MLLKSSLWIIQGYPQIVRNTDRSFCQKHIYPNNFFNLSWTSILRKLLSKRRFSSIMHSFRKKSFIVLIWNNMLHVGKQIASAFSKWSWAQRMHWIRKLPKTNTSLDRVRSNFAWKQKVKIPTYDFWPLPTSQDTSVQGTKLTTNK